MKTIKERLIYYIESKGMTQTAFAKSIGKTDKYFASFKSPRIETLDVIHSLYPDLSINWLLYNDGSMLNESKSDSDIHGMSLPQMPEVPQIPANQEGNNAIFEALIKTLNVQKDAFDLVVDNLKNQLEDERKFRNEKMNELERHILNQSSQISTLIEKVNLITKDKNGKKAS